MKNLNVMKYLAHMSVVIDKTTQKASEAEDMDTARLIANRAVGYINAVVELSNTLICTENNELTQQMDELETEWMRDIYQALVDVAVKVGDNEALVKYAKKRDDCRD